MPNLYNLIKIKYETTFLIRPKILSTILFIPFIYLLGWFSTRPFLFIGLDTEKLSSLGTIVTFLIFASSMPRWFEMRWGIYNSWILLGVNKVGRKDKMIFYFFKGFLYALILLLAIIIPLVAYKWGSWQGILSPQVLLNAILLVIAVGFAEELIFRGWLVEELKNQYGQKKAIVIQAILFSFAHLGFDMPYMKMISILFGLFLLGILLSFLRLRDDNCLWGCIGLHGGLVGIWFIVNNGLIEISKDAPVWLVGPGNINTNPLGGLYGINLLIFCSCYVFINIRKTYSK